jgi:hypothetical protein
MPLPIPGNYTVSLEGVAWWNCYELNHSPNVAGQTVPTPFAGDANGPLWFAGARDSYPIGLYLDLKHNGAVVTSQNVYVTALGQLYGYAIRPC